MLLCSNQLTVNLRTLYLLQIFIIIKKLKGFCFSWVRDSFSSFRGYWNSQIDEMETFADKGINKKLEKDWLSYEQNLLSKSIFLLVIFNLNQFSISFVTIQLKHKLKTYENDVIIIPLLDIPIKQLQYNFSQHRFSDI
jgi:hypothetical protein